MNQEKLADMFLEESSGRITCEYFEFEKDIHGQVTAYKLEQKNEVFIFLLNKDFFQDANKEVVSALISLLKKNVPAKSKERQKFKIQQFIDGTGKFYKLKRKRALRDLIRYFEYRKELSEVQIETLNLLFSKFLEREENGEQLAGYIIECIKSYKKDED